jgi:hypothetical protein
LGIIGLDYWIIGLLGTLNDGHIVDLGKRINVRLEDLHWIRSDLIWSFNKPIQSHRPPILLVVDCEGYESPHRYPT